MRFLGRLLVVLAGLAAVLAAASYLLPREVAVARSITIAAPPAAIFPWLNSLQKFAEWSPWHALDPEMTQSFSGPETGVGARMEWSSDDPAVGSGVQTITMSEPDALVGTEIDFGGQGTAASSLTLEPAGAETQVIWGLVADMGNNPVGRWMGLMMDDWIGADYDRGLARLKAIVEAQ